MFSWQALLKGASLEVKGGGGRQRWAEVLTRKLAHPGFVLDRHVITDAKLKEDTELTRIMR